MPEYGSEYAGSDVKTRILAGNIKHGREKMATKKELLNLIRANCGECMGGPRVHEGVWPVINPSDIENCSSPLCAFFKYRQGNDPNKSPARVKAGKRLASAQALSASKKL